jgi:hypothetical protein
VKLSSSAEAVIEALDVAGQPALAKRFRELADHSSTREAVIHVAAYLPSVKGDPVLLRTVAEKLFVCAQFLGMDPRAEDFGLTRRSAS